MDKFKTIEIDGEILEIGESSDLLMCCKDEEDDDADSK